VIFSVLVSKVSASKTKNLPLNGSPTPVITFMTSLACSEPLSGRYTTINGNSTQTGLMTNPLSSSTTGNSTTSIELSIDKSGGKLNEYGYPISPDSIRIEDPSYYVLAYIIKIS
jgi:hypothetical protein